VGRAASVGGLRLRLVLALVGTSVITLLVASAALLPPLENRLVRDRFSDLRLLARTTRLALRDLPDRTVEPGSPSAKRLLLVLRARTGGRVALYDSDGRPLVVTDPGPARDAGGLAAIRAAGLSRHGDVREGIVGDDAVVVAGVRRPESDRLVLVLRRSLRETRAAADEVRRAALVAGLVGVLVALLVAVALSRRLLGRLGRLREDARALGEQGLDHEVTVGRPDEVGEVAAALEAMRVRLVTTERSRQAFLATASHELRTPLATLQGTLELLAEGMAADGAAAPLQARTATSLRLTGRLVDLSTDLLDVSRLDGQARLSAEPVELGELVAIVRDEASGALEREQRALEVHAPARAHALADLAATLRIVRILIDNAVGYGAGTVTVTVADGVGTVRLSVADQGPGVVEQEREQIFARFERGSAAGSRSGFGLGLALARGLAEAMRGTLDYVPSSEGACFVLVLPAWHEDS
jgi:signal transduction histidine kinase